MSKKAASHKKAIVVLLVQLMALSASAVNVDIDGISYNLIGKTGTATVVPGEQSYYGDIVIPESVKYEGRTYTVTVIGRTAFYLCRALVSVTLPETITTFEDHAFDHSGIQTINIPKGMTKITGDCFDACTSLRAVHITDLTAWCGIEFEGYLSNPLTYAHHLYLNGEEIKDLCIPDGLTYVGYATFSGGSNFSSVSLPESITSIGPYAFYDCTGLKEIVLPTNLNYINQSAFQGCRNLEGMAFPNDDVGIGTWAFMDCKRITSAVMPRNTETINQEIFKGCGSLLTVTIPSGVKKILWGAFSNCPELTDVYCYAERVPEAYYDTFAGSMVEYATLHVPAAAISDYMAADTWKEFGHIVALTGEESSIEVATANGDTPTHYYNIGGQSIGKPQRGVNIVRLNNRRIIKEFGLFP